MSRPSSTFDLASWLDGTTVTATGTQTVPAAPRCTESTGVSFGGGNASGCGFTNIGSIEPFHRCCGNSPLIVYDDGCQLACAKPNERETNELEACINAIGRKPAGIVCQAIKEATTTTRASTLSTPTATTSLSTTTTTGAAEALYIPVPKGYKKQGMFVAGLLATGLLAGLWP